MILSCDNHDVNVRQNANISDMNHIYCSTNSGNCQMSALEKNMQNSTISSHKLLTKRQSKGNSRLSTFNFKLLTFNCILLLCCLFFGNTAFAQMHTVGGNVKTVGTETSTSTSSKAPVDNFYRYTYTQILYTASELGATSGTINSIGFQYAYATAMTAKTDVEIYLGNTSKTSFSSNTDNVTSGLTLVYSGPLNCSQGWNDFPLSSGFSYSGGGLIVTILDKSNNYNSSSYTFTTTTTTNYMTKAWYSDSYSTTDYTSPNTSMTKAYYQYRPNTRFSFGNRSYLAPVNNYYCYTYSQVLYTAAELGSTAGVITTIGYEYAYSEAMTKKTNVEIYMGNTSKTSFSSNTDNVTSGQTLVYSGPLNCSPGWNDFELDAPFDYTGGGLIVTVLDKSGNYDGTSFVFATTQTTNYMTKAWYSDSYKTDDYTSPNTSMSKGYYQWRPNTRFNINPKHYDLPVNNWFRYTYSQVLYKAADLGGQAGLITSIGYQYAHTSPMTAKTNVEIYMGNTSKTSFSSNTDNVTSGLTLVYTGDLNCSQGWNDFDLDAPFDYTGGGLIVTILDKSNNYNGTAFVFATTPTTDYMSKSWYSDSYSTTDYTSPNTSMSKNYYQYRPNTRFHVAVKHYDLPVNNYYKYTYSQVLYKAADLGYSCGNITHIGYQYASSTAMTKKTNVEIYMGNTSKTSFTADDDNVTSGLTLVYSGNLNCSQGWNDFVLNTPFRYDGGGLIVTVLDKSGQYDGSSYYFGTSPTTNYMSKVWYSDSYSTTDYATPNTSMSKSRPLYRPNTRFTVTTPTPCADAIAMTAGQVYSGTLGICGIWDTYADCSWEEPGEERVFSFTPSVTGEYTLSAEQIDGDPDFFFMSSCGTSGTNYTGNWNYGDQTLTLTAGTTYYFIVDNADYEYTAEFEISVSPNCVSPAVPTNLTVSNITSTTATVSWNANGASSWKYSINGGSTWTPVNTNSVNLTGLTPGTQYTFQVKAVNGNCESSVVSTIFTTLNYIATPSVTSTCGINQSFTISVSPTASSYKWQYKYGDNGWYDCTASAGGSAPGHNGYSGGTSQTITINSFPNDIDILWRCQINGTSIYTDPVTIHYHVLPTVSITKSPNITELTCTNSSITLTPSVSGQTSYGWSAGGSGTAAISATSAGTYTLTATNSTTGCNNSASVVITDGRVSPAEPTNLTVSNITSATATVSWNANGASSWKYSINGGSTWTSTSSTSVNLTGLNVGTSYTFQVKAVNGNCESSVASTTFTTLNRYTVTVSASPNAGGTVSGGGTYDQGTPVTVTATADGCYDFVNWKEGNTVVSTSASYTFDISANRNLTANFAIKQYTVTATASPSAGGSVSGSGTYDCNGSANLTATPNTGYHFVKWTENGSQVGTAGNTSYTINNIQANHTLVANFETNTSVSISAVSETCTENGTSLTATATGFTNPQYLWSASPNTVTWPANTNSATINVTPTSAENYTFTCEVIESGASGLYSLGQDLYTDSNGDLAASGDHCYVMSIAENKITVLKAGLCGGPHYAEGYVATTGMTGKTATEALLPLSPASSMIYYLQDNGYYAKGWYIPSADEIGAFVATTAGRTVFLTESNFNYPAPHFTSTVSSDGSVTCFGVTRNPDPTEPYSSSMSYSGSGPGAFMAKEFSLGVSASATITVKQTPDAGITNNTGVMQIDCTNQSISLTATGGDTYAWSNSVSTAANSGLTEAGTYKVTVTGANGCTATESITLTKDVSTPDVTVTGTNEVCLGVSTTLHTTTDANYTYLWSNGITASDNEVTPGATIEYTVTTTDSRNGCQTTGSRTVTVNTPDIASASSYDYIWRGASTDWNTSANWYMYSGGNYSVASGEMPATSKNYYIGTGDCLPSDQWPSLSADAIVGNVTINGGSVTVPANKTLSIAGSVTGTLTAQNNSTIAFVGSDDQTLSDAATFSNVTIAQTVGGKKIIAPNGITVNGTATFGTGVVSANVTFGGSASATGASLTSYVDGTVTKTLGSSAFTFPIGNNGVLGEVDVPATRSGATVSMRFNKAADGGFDVENDGYPRWWNINDMCAEDGANIFHHVSNAEYWDISSTAEVSGVNFRSIATSDVHFNDTSINQRDVEAIKFALYDGCWKNMGGTASVDAPNYYELSVSGVTIPATNRAGLKGSFGSTDDATLLPIELTSFTATCDGRSALIEWTTATERNNDYFSLERSDDAINFVEVARVAGAGNSIEPLDYSYTDYGIHGGDNYYRLVQVDYDGTRSVSDIVVVNCIETAAGEPDVLAYPNPFDGELTLELDNFDNRPARIDVYDMLGKLIYTDKVASPQNYYETVLNLSNLPPATYTVRVSTADFVINRKVVKQ